MLSNQRPDFVKVHPQILSSIIQKINIDKFKFSGYLEVKLDDSVKSKNLKTWRLFFSRGKIVFSGFETISFANVLSVLSNYILNLRDRKTVSSEIIKKLTDRSQTEKDILMVRLLGELALADRSLDYHKFTEVIQSHIVADSEKYLFSDISKAKLVPSKQIDYLRPIVGLDTENLLSIAKLRRTQWKKIENIIPSTNYYVRSNIKSSQWEQLPLAEKVKIKKIIGVGNTIEDIRYKLGEDNLKIAQVFSRLIAKELVVFSPYRQGFAELDDLSFAEKEIKANIPKIAIIDDSPVLLKQLSSMVKTLGYRVECCSDALEAVDFLLKAEAKIIFIDVNMPELSGFGLMKQIRIQPQLHSIPLVILTAEKTVMNQQRAKWSKSKFLSKPLSPDDKTRFITELKAILKDLAPIK